MTKKMKPSKRGKKVNKVSLHCSPMIITEEKRIIKWTRYIKAIAEFLKALMRLVYFIKPLIEFCKSFIDML